MTIRDTLRLLAEREAAGEIQADATYSPEKGITINASTGHRIRERLSTQNAYIEYETLPPVPTGDTADAIFARLTDGIPESVLDIDPDAAAAGLPSPAGSPLSRNR